MLTRTKASQQQGGTMMSVTASSPATHEDQSPPPPKRLKPESELQKYPDGTKFRKNFRVSVKGKERFRFFVGEVKRYDPETKWYLVKYEDDDEEELNESELEELREELLRAQEARDRYSSKFRSKATAMWIMPVVDTAVPRVDAVVVEDATCLFQLHGIARPTGFRLPKFGSFNPGSSENSLIIVEFFLFVYERQCIWVRRTRGDQAPWSANPLFQEYSWCNIYRELDRGSTFFRMHVLNVYNEMFDSKGGDAKQFLRHILFSSYVYRLCNRLETFNVTGLPQQESELKKFFACLNKLLGTCSLFTAAHQTTNLSNYKMFIRQTTKSEAKGSSLFDRVFDDILVADGDVKAILDTLHKLHGVGDFMSWQIFCDLQEARCIVATAAEGENYDNYCLLGPGALAGLEIFPQCKGKGKKLKLEFAQQLAAHHNAIYRQLGIEFPYWQGRPLTIKEIEHALCEFSKFRDIRKCKANGKKDPGRIYHSQPTVDGGKPCQNCKQQFCGKNNGQLCDTCKLFFCAGCIAKNQTPSARDGSISYMCQRCETFER